MRLRSRFLLLFGVLAVTAAIFLAAVLDSTLRRAVEDRVADRFERELDHIAVDLNGIAGGERDDYLRRCARELSCRITLIASDGHVLDDTDLLPADVPSMENHAGRPEVIEARESGKGQSRRFSATEQERRFYSARLLPDANVLRFSVSEASIRQIESSYVWSARLAIFFVCLLLFLIGAAASRRFSHPIARLTEAASAIAAGEPRDLPAAGGEEVQLLTAALQRMKSSLALSADHAQGERRLTALVFEKLPDGLVILDAKLHVLEANERFAQMIGLNTPAGRALYDLLRHRALYEVFETALASGQSVERTVRLADEIVWQVAVVSLPSGSRAAAVGVLRDVTRLERTEMMRRTFVADVSHELRTPIASIVAAAETLESGQPDEGETAELVGLIRRQSDHMKELIDDLMDLSQIESGAVVLQRELIPVPDLLREVGADLAPEVGRKGLFVDVAGDEASCVFGDRRRLGQVVRNLLDNAIKFSPSGERITLTAFREPGWAGFSVADRGPGVARAERDKIFQRFYQIDRSRSKTRPGSGLGLAIVKHIVQLHGGSVQVEGEPGLGATFAVRLPAVST
jgi:two-component system phosphate regulon sensor histidine kinase PhoR